MNNFLLGQPWALKLVWAVNVQNYTILPGTLGMEKTAKDLSPVPPLCMLLDQGL
jgi:hypothetical protein